MKKTLFLFVAMVMITTVSQAQEDFSKFRMGFKMSPNISWMQPQDKHFINEGSVARFGFGFVADIFFAQNYAVGTGVNIMRQGGQLSYLEEDRLDDVDYIIRRNRTYSNQYVEIPLTFKLRTNEIGYITYWGQFGFGLGVNINSRGDDTKEYLLSQVFDTTSGDLIGWSGDVLPDPKASTEENTNFTDDIQLFRMSLLMGAGIEYNLSGSTSILVGINYNNGFTNVMAKENVIKTSDNEPVFDPGFNPETVKLRAISNSLELNVGILF